MPHFSLSSKHSGCLPLYPHPTHPPSASQSPFHTTQCNPIKITRASRLQIQHRVAQKTLEMQWPAPHLSSDSFEHLNLPAPPWMGGREGTLRLATCLCFPAQSTSRRNTVSQQLATAGIAFLPSHVTWQPTHHSVMRCYLQNISRICLLLIPATTILSKNTVPLQPAVPLAVSEQMRSDHPFQAQHHQVLVFSSLRGSLCFMSARHAYKMDITSLLCRSRSAGVYKVDS